MFRSKYSLDKNNPIFSMFHVEYVAEQYGLRNTTSSRWSKDLASECESVPY
jgi:hypothetical protein